MGSMMCGHGTEGEGSHERDTSESELDILDKGYARGEISREKYEERKKPFQIKLTGGSNEKFKHIL
jgi:uncharacterized membrane protein